MAAEPVQTAEQRAAAEVSKFIGGATRDGEAINSADPEANMTDAERRILADEAAAAEQAGKAVRKEPAAKAAGTPKPKSALDIARMAIAHANGEAVAELEQDESDPGTETEEAEEGEAEEGAEPAKPAVKQPPTPNHKSAQARIDQAVAKQRAAEREAQAVRDELARIRAGGAPAAAIPTPAADTKDKLPEGLPPAPDPSKFEFGEADPKYTAALAGWETRKVILEEREATKALQAQAEQSEQVRRTQERVKEIAEQALDKYPDFDQVVVEGGRQGKWPLSPVLGELILNSAHGADIAYTLATNLSEAERVFRLSPLAQAAYFGKIEAFFENEAPSQAGAEPQEGKSAAKPSKAPAPVKQARGQGGNAAPLSPDTPDFAAFERMVEAGRKRKG